MKPIILLALQCLPAWADTHRSSFGFSFQLSKDWLVLTPGKAADAFAAETQKGLGLESGNAEQIAAVLERVKTGQVEFYFYRRNAAKGFANNISVQLVPDEKAFDGVDVEKSCLTLAQDLKQVYGVPVVVKNCGKRRSNGLSYAEFEYMIPARASFILQQEIPYPNGTRLTIVGGSDLASLADVTQSQREVVKAVTAHVRRKQNAK